MANSFEMIVGATLPSLAFNYLDEAGTPVDISGYTIQLKIRRGAIDTLTKTATLTNPTQGVASFTWSPTDFNAAGSWPAQIVITTTSGGIYKADSFCFEVQAAIT